MLFFFSKFSDDQFCNDWHTNAEVIIWIIHQSRREGGLLGIQCFFDASLTLRDLIQWIQLWDTSLFSLVSYILQYIIVFYSSSSLNSFIRTYVQGFVGGNQVHCRVSIGASKLIKEALEKATSEIRCKFEHILKTLIL